MFAGVCRINELDLKNQRIGPTTITNATYKSRRNKSIHLRRHIFLSMALCHAAFFCACLFQFRRKLDGILKQSEIGLAGHLKEAPRENINLPRLYFKVI